MGRRGVPDRVELARVVVHGRGRRQQDGAEAAGSDAFDLLDGVSDIGDRYRRGRRELGEVRREPLDDVVVVDASVGHRQFMVVGVEPEEREVRVHDLDVDAVQRHVLDDLLRIALGHPPAGLPVARDRPAVETGRVQPPEDPCAALHHGLDLEVLFPHPAIAQLLGQARLEEVGRLQDVAVGGDDYVILGGDDEIPLAHSRCPSR